MMRSSERTARKEHWCMWCGGTIAAGERHVDAFWIAEGEPWYGRAHCDCHAFAITVGGRIDGGDGIPAFDDWLGHGVEDLLSAEELAEHKRLTDRGLAQARAAEARRQAAARVAQ